MCIIASCMAALIVGMYSIIFGGLFVAVKNMWTAEGALNMLE